MQVVKRTLFLHRRIVPDIQWPMGNGKLLLVLLLFFTTTLLFGQRFNGGLTGGISVTEISGDHVEGPHKVGAYVGGFVNTYFSKKSSVQMELDFIQKGSRKNPDSTNYDFYLLRLNYIELFTHYKWDFAKVFTLEGGLSLGVLINSYEEANYQELTEPPFDAMDFSANIGLYVKLSEHWKFNVRYSNSILSVRPNFTGVVGKRNNGQYNEVLSFVFHYQFKSKK
jgi:hypothetical protein